jgi:hypothetical protein
MRSFTTIFVLPSIVSPVLYFKLQKVINSDSFVNCYLGDVDKPEYDDHLLMVFNNEMKMTELKILESLSNYINLYTKDEYIVVVFELDHDNDYYKLISGRYTEIDDIMKEKILKFWELAKDSAIGSLLHKTIVNEEDVKVDEWCRFSYSTFTDYYSKPQMFNEILGF